MKVAWLGIDYHDPELLQKTWYRHNYQAILDHLSKKVEVVCYANHYCGTWNKEYDVEKIVAKEEPDVIILYDSVGWKNLDRVKVLKVARFSDPWDGYKQQLEFANRNGIDVVLLKFHLALDYYRKHIKNCEVVGFPHQVDENIFHPSLSLTRHIDVWCTGNFNRKTHPIRHKALETIPEHPQIESRLGPGHDLSVEDFVKLINESKIGVFDDVHKPLLGSSRWNRKIGRWAVGRWWENMSCGTLCMANMPDCAEQLHLEADVNFVEVNTENLLEKTLYYLKHDNERREIAKRGYETFLKYHTCEKRVEQMLDVINRCL